MDLEDFSQTIVLCKHELNMLSSKGVMANSRYFWQQKLWGHVIQGSLGQTNICQGEGHVQRNVVRYELNPCTNIEVTGNNNVIWQ